MPLKTPLSSICHVHGSSRCGHEEGRKGRVAALGGGTTTPVAVSNTVIVLPSLTRFDVRQWHNFYQHRVLRKQLSNLDAIYGIACQLGGNPWHCLLPIQSLGCVSVVGANSVLGHSLKALHSFLLFVRRHLTSVPFPPTHTCSTYCIVRLTYSSRCAYVRTKKYHPQKSENIHV